MEYSYMMNGKSLTIDKEKCIGCGICSQVCPHTVFEFVPHQESASKTYAEIRNRDRCMECGACALNCPRGAITVKKGVGCAGAIIGSMFNGGVTSCGCECSVEPKSENKKKKRNVSCC